MKEKNSEKSTLLKKKGKSSPKFIQIQKYVTTDITLY